MGKRKKKKRPRRKQGGVVVRRKTKELKNPYFSKQAKRKIRKGIAVAAVVMAPFLILGIIISFISAPRLAITDVKIHIDGEISEDQIRSVVDESFNEKFLGIFSRNNFFLLHTNKIHDQLKTDSNFASVSAEKEFPNRLIVRVRERRIAYIVVTNDVQLSVSDDGIAFEVIHGAGGGEPLPEPVLTTPESATGTPVTTSTIKEMRPGRHPMGKLVEIVQSRSTSSYHILYDTYSPSVSIGEEAIPEQVRTSLRRAARVLQSQHDLSIVGGIFNRALTHELFLVTNESWYIIFDPGFDITEALENVNVLLNERINDREGLEYIDVRYTDRVFYK